MLTFALLFACAGPAGSDPGTPPPEPVPAAPDPFRVQLVAVGEPISGFTVVFGDPDDGRRLVTTRTGPDGFAAAAVAPGAVVTVVNGDTMTTFLGLPDGAIVDLGYPGLGGDIRELVVLPFDEVDGAVRYRASTGCGDSSWIQPDLPSTLTAAESCLDDGRIDLLATAYDPDGRALAVTVLAKVPVPPEGGETSLLPWVFELEPVTIAWEGTPPPPADLVTWWQVGWGGRWFSAGGREGPPAADVWSVSAGPASFGPKTFELSHQHFGSAWGVTRVHRFEEVPAEIAVPSSDFAPDLESEWDAATATLTLSGGAMPDPVVSVFAQVRLVDEDGIVHLWNVVAPPGTDTLAIPELPDDLRGLEMFGITASLVAADPETASALGHHWTVTPTRLTPPRDRASLRWLVWSDLQTPN